MTVDRQLVKSYIVGDCGEIVTANALRGLKGMSVVRNLYIPHEAYETEIDMVAVSEYGVYVVENKNYHAKIEGNIRDKYWLCRYELDCEELLFNPILQNKKHVDAIKTLLGKISAPIYNVVIFNDLTKLDLKGFNGWAFTVSDFVKKYETITPVKKKKTLSYEQVDDIVETLKEYSDDSFERKCEFVMGLLKCM